MDGHRRRRELFVRRRRRRSPAGARRSSSRATACVGLDPATGAIQFQRRWRARIAASVNAATPLVDRRLDLRLGRVRARRRRAARRGFQADDVWASDEALSNHYATSVYHDGYLYGYHGRQEFGPSLRAVEFKTGTVKWSQDQFRAGSVTLAGDKLLIMREGGELILAPASPQAFKPLARAQVLPGVGAAATRDRRRLRLRAQREHACLSRPSALRHVRCADF